MKNKRNIIFIIVFLTIFLLNTLTPLLLDDYAYSLKFNSSIKIKNIYDIFIFQKNHYFNWGGRVLAHTIGQVFLLLPKFFFNIFNSIMFVLEGYLIYKIVDSNDNIKDDTNYILCIIYLLLWFLNPIFGQINLWLIGSCNYLWTMCIMLFYLYLFINEKDSLLYKILLLIFALLSGMCNENTSLSIIIITILYIIIYKNINRYKIISILFSICSYIFLIVAPGNYIRQYKGNYSFISYIIFNISTKLIYLLFPLLVLLLLIIIYRKKLNKFIYIIFIGITINIFSLVVVREIFFRNYYSSLIYCFMILVCIIKMFPYKFLKYICFVMTFIFTIQYMFTINDFIDFHYFFKERNSILVNASNNKEKNVIIKSYFSNNSKIPVSVDLFDLNNDYTDFPNNIFEKYYKIDKIIMEEE